MNPKTLADKLKELMAKSGLNPSKFAVSIGITPQRLQKYLNNENNPNAEVVEKIRQVYGVDVLGDINKSVKNAPHETDSTRSKYDAGNMYRTFFEEQTDYLVIPKIMFEDYEIVPKAEQEAKREMYRHTIEQHMELIAMAKKNLEDLRKAQDLGRGLRKQNVQ